MWLFALMAHDGLSNLHPLLWGVPLVLALFYLVGFATHSCYKDFAELKKGLKADEEGEPENGDGLEATAGENGDGLESTAAHGADASSPGDDAPAWFDDADAEAGRAPEEEQDEEEAVSRPTTDEQSQFDMAIDVMLCNYKDEAGVLGQSATAEATPVPPPPQNMAQLF